MDYLLFILSQTRPTHLDVIATPPLVAVLIWLGVTDWQSFRLPDAGTLPLIMCGLLLAVWRDGSVPVDQVIGAVAGFAVFWAIGAAYFRARGIDALGLGDAKLLAAAGAWMGWQALPSIILVSGEEDYNQNRPHSALGNLTPNEFTAKMTLQKQTA